MKKDTTGMEKSNSPKYWLSLEEWRNDPEFKKLAEQEFMSSPLQSEEGKDGWARREFLKLMGASLALTSFGCVRRPAEKIVPYVNRPHDLVPGINNYYASSWKDVSEVLGTVVTTREGRPIKVDGNAEYPGNEGGMSARGHAHILALYDPDRLSGPKQNLLNEKKTNRDTINADWQTLDKAVAKQLSQGGVALLTGSLASPSTEAVVSDFASAFDAKHFVWDAISYDAVRDGQRSAFGRAVVPNYRLDRARYIVSVDCDFLGTYLSPVAFMRDWSKLRKPGENMNRLVSFESLLTLTGMNADDRYRIRPSQQLTVLMGLLHELVVKQQRSRYANDSAVMSALKPYTNAAQTLGLPAELFSKLAEELWNHRGESLVMAGGMQTQTPWADQVHAAANLLNVVLENDGRTIDANRGLSSYHASGSDLNSLIEGLNSGAIKTVIIHGTNPAYALPESAGFEAALKKAEMVLYTGDRVDEVGRFADYIVPDHHPMENWGDHEGRQGIVAIQQPTIRPLHNTRAFQESLISWAKAADRGSARLKGGATWYDYLRDYWRTNIYKGGDFEGFWTELLQKGVYITGTASDSSPRSFASSALTGKQPQAPEGYELVLYPTIGLRDGSLANVPWLQEFPDPVTKICWDNYLTVSPADAQKEGLQEGQVLIVKANGVSVKAPVHIQPGQAPGVLGLAIGYGRDGMGQVADGVGVNAFRLAGYNAGKSIYSGIGATVEKTTEVVKLANTQGHHSMEGRQIVVEATLAQYQKKASAGIHKHKVFSIWDEHKYPNHKWGMVIDLNQCTGCSACVVACQSENNIPVVGKKNVLNGREMHWLRIDRYYTGEPDNPGAVFQPLPCQHCDNAPCETVCPVLATVHSDEGTNDMIYNRCVGTRYCSNNCPYKVRRFNWFNYVKDVREPMNYALNPEVTVRSRGVMEKCTFCIHRIKTAKMQAKTENRVLKDGDVRTACQDSCPTNAIVFGDLKDPESQVSQLFNQERSYSLLEELNTKPAVKYLTKIRNTEELKSGGGHHEEGHHS